MSTRRTPSVNAFLPTAILFAATGWGGLLLMTNYALPTLGPRWLFFFLIVVAVTGTFLPAAAFLNHRFATQPPAGGNVVLRQALWFGIYAATLAWLQVGRVFSGALALILLIGFIAIEVLLRVWEQSQWRGGRGE